MREKRAQMISRPYLRQSADKGGNVEVTDIQDRPGFTTNITNATVVNYAYKPELLNRGLEREFAAVEAHDVPSPAKLRCGHTFSAEEKYQFISFLDMHLQRGRYAAQTKVRIHAILL